MAQIYKSMTLGLLDRLSEDDLEFLRVLREKMAEVHS